LSGYLRVNARFADELSKLLRPDDVVWVHDYHLLPFARALRERGHDNKIGFFLHVPFPPPEILTALPNHQRLIPDLAHYDLVGFQTENDAANFSRYLSKECMMPRRDRDTFQTGERVMRIGVFPIGIETAEFHRLARRSVKADFVKQTVASLAGRDMIIGVDRLDYSKGLRLRMEAFESFLATAPQFRSKVSYLQITPKSRSDIREYEDMERQISETVGRINGAFGEAAWTPIRYVNRAHSRTALAGLYRSARAALVTPLRDGMNLVAKEYVAAQDEEDPGVLLLSRFAGAACELDAALIVNPYDPEGVGNSLARALTMPLAERRRRHEEMYQVLLANDVKFWGERFLTTLTRPHAVPTWLVRSGAFLQD
jgi:trehalose 6-phosphate synthase